MLNVSRFNLYFRNTDDDRVLVFNTLTRGIVFLSGQLADDLQSFQSEDSHRPPLLSPAEIDSLVNAGILLRATLSDNSKLEFKYQSLKYSSRQLYVTTFFTEACNFGCSYCYQDRLTSSECMSMDQWKRVFGLICRQADQASARTIYADLFGGEPLLNAEVLLQAAADLRSLASDDVSVWIAMPSNGSLLTKDLAEKLGRLIDRIVITLDGPESRHNRLRPFMSGEESFSSVINGIRLALESPIPHVVVRNNITLQDYDEIRSFARELPTILEHTRKPFASFAPISSPMSSFGEECNTANSETHIAALKLLMESPAYGYQPIATAYSSGHCPAARSNSFVIGSDLRVFKCQVQMPDASCAEIRPNGNLIITDDSWYDIVTWDSTCKSQCVYGPLCNGGCPVLGTQVDIKTCTQRMAFDASLEDLIRIQVESNAL